MGSFNRPVINVNFNNFKVQPLQELAESHSEIDFCFKSVCGNQKREEAILGKFTTQIMQQDNGCCEEGDSVFELIQNCLLDLLPTQHGPVRMQKMSDIVISFYSVL